MESVGGSPPTCELDVAIAVEGPLGEDAARRELSLRAIAFGQRFAPVAFSPAAEGGRCAAQLAASLRLSGEADAAAAWVATNEPVRVEVLERAQVNSQPRVLATCILAQPRLDGADASDAASGWAFADGGMRAEPAERAPALAPSGAGAEGSGAAEQSGAPAHEHEPIGWGAWRCRLRLRLRAGASEAGARALADADGGARRACVAPSAVDAPPARARFHLLLRFSTLRLRRGLSPLAVLGALQLEASFAGSAPFASALVQWSEIARAHEAEREARGGAVQGSVAAAAADSAPAEPPFALATEFVGGALARLDFSPAQFGDAAVLRAVRDTPVVVRLVLHAQRAQGGGDAEPSPLELAAGAVPLTPLAAARMGLAQGGGGGAHDGALATSAILPCDGMLALAAGAERYFSAPADASSAASSIAADSWAAEGLPDDAICAVTVHAQLCAQAAAPARAAPRARARSRSPPQTSVRSPARSPPPPPVRRAPAVRDFAWACEQQPALAAGGGGLAGAHVPVGGASRSSEWQFRLCASMLRVTDAGFATSAALNLFAKLYTHLGAAAGARDGGGDGVPPTGGTLSARAVATRPAVALRKGSSAALPPHALALVLTATPAALLSALSACPLLLELWHRDRYAADEPVAAGTVDLVELLTVPPSPVPLAAALGGAARAAAARGVAPAVAPVWRRELRLHVPLHAVGGKPGEGALGRAPGAFALVLLELFESPLPPPRSARARAVDADEAPPTASAAAHRRPATADGARAPRTARGGSMRAKAAADGGESVPRRLLDAVQRQYALRERQREQAQHGQAQALLAIEAKLRAHAAVLRTREAALAAAEAGAGAQHAARLRAAESALAAAALAARQQRHELDAEQARMAAKHAELAAATDALRAELHSSKAALASTRESSATQLAQSRAEAAALRETTAQLEASLAEREAQRAAAAAAAQAGDARLRAALHEAEAVRLAHERQIARLLQHTAKQTASLGLEALARSHGQEQQEEAVQLAALREQLNAEAARAREDDERQARDGGEGVHAPASAPPAVSLSGAARVQPPAQPSVLQPDEDTAQAAERLRVRRDSLLQSGLYTASDALIVRMQAQLKALAHRAAAL
ncbi:hypothetical protein KFE25_007168 [Diacronema lutheri]|uniref:Centrosomal protein of 120 kDa n=1 Tax=Diacronema lutheri TaxID=2081491 RepID=A0A8J5XFY3_DIALT|nr:hypothetical protein KFE25_007168 [Diacronema lutheri]